MEKSDTFRIRSLNPATLREQRDRTLSLLRGLFPYASIMEVGSTALDGLIGKQDIDFVVRAPLHSFIAMRNVLDKTFPRNSQQLSNDEFQGYIVPSELDVSIQLIVEGSEHDHFEAFLRALKKDPSLMAAYNHLKTQWDGQPMTGYRSAKQRFINSVLGIRE